MIYEVVEVLSQRPPAAAPLFDAVVEAFGWDPLPQRPEATDSTEMREGSEEEHQAVEQTPPAPVVSVTKSTPAEEAAAHPEQSVAPKPDNSQPCPRVRKPRPRQESEPRTVSLIRSA